MDNMDKIVDGYYFENENEARLAERELNTIKYLREMNNMKNPKVIYQVYVKMVKQKMFVTPVGISYMKNLQRQLLAHFDRKDVPPVPVMQNDYTPTAELLNNKKRQMEFNDVGKNYRNKLKVAIIVNVMLLAALAVMIFIASTTDSAHILNYENVLIDRYEQWENELETREEQLNSHSKK